MIASARPEVVFWCLLDVLTNGHTGHVPRAPGFFRFEGPQLAVVKYYFKTYYFITIAKINWKGNPVNTF